MHRLVLIGLLPILIAAHRSDAQESTVLTESEFLSALGPSHPALRESAESLRRARAREVASRTLENPVLEMSREDLGGPTVETELLVSWKIPDASRPAEIRRRNREIEAAQARFDQELLEHRLAMREAYARWALAAERRERLAKQAERVQSLAAREAHRSARGEASGLEVHRLRLAAGALRSRAALAAGMSESARAEAAAWTPLEPNAHPHLPHLPPLPDMKGPSPRMRAARADLAAAQLAREATARVLSSPEISLGWKRDELGPETADGPIVGFAWSMPLFDRKRAAREVSEARVDAEAARLERVEQETIASRHAARRNYEDLVAALDGARRDSEVNDRMLDGAEAAFHHGESSLTDLLETHRSVSEAELARLDLYEAALAAHRDLERLSGPAGFTTLFPTSERQSTTTPGSQEPENQESLP